MKRTALLYLLMRVMAGAIIAGVLPLGRTLPVPGGTGAIGFPRAAHGGNPIMRLFLQLLVILVAAQSLGWVFLRFGQPAVVGALAARMAGGSSPVPRRLRRPAVKSLPLP